MGANPSQVLRVRPDFFDVEYAINPYMEDEQGELKKIDQKLALSQWEKIGEVYRNLGLDVVELPGVKGLPDMVFCANTSFPFMKNGKKVVVPSHMKSDFRKAEVDPIIRFYEENDYKVLRLKASASFEANGDALYDGKVIWGGYGHRSDQAVYAELSELLEVEVRPLRLVSEHFYHLDTCFALLGEGEVAVVEEAFDEASLKLIKKSFRSVLPIDKAEALESFAANLHCPNGKDVLIQAGAKKTIRGLLERGYRVLEVNTSEFMKSGGSVFCMKMMIYG